MTPMETGMDFLLAVAFVDTAIVVGVVLLVLWSGLRSRQ
jgi:hypothetical protein